MKFPYGISDFREIVTHDYFLCDRTAHIAWLEEAGKYLLFIRPRRFGKSLLLSMLANYYDVARQDQFEAMFGRLKIGASPSALKNRYFILRWDFSCVDPMGTAVQVRRALHDHLNACIKRFVVHYRSWLSTKIEIDPANAINSIMSLVTAAENAGMPVYLLIDEYDNFANEIMMGVRREREGLYEALVYEEGPLKTLFKAIKASTSDSVFDRIFITGVSPVVMSDMTSGYNIAEDMYNDPLFNDLCGFTEAEIQRTLERILPGDAQGVSEALGLMQTFYNGYTFSQQSQTRLFNPTLAIYFFKHLARTGKYPIKLLDSNLSTDDAKLQYVAGLNGGGQFLLDIMESPGTVVVDQLEDRFGIKQVIHDRSRDYRFIASFLYYFGVVTLDGETPRGKISLRVPNLVIQGLYVQRLERMLLPEPVDRNDGRAAADALHGRGDMGPLCAFIEQRYFKVFRNADYRWANELTVKTAFLTLLYNDILYIMDSEPEIDRGRVDLTMIVRPDKRRFDILDILIEFKFVKLGEAGLSGENARQLDLAQLRRLPVLQARMQESCDQARGYGRALEQRHGQLRLKCFAVVALGFERLWCQAV